ncbi:MAG: transcription-repair coupling factor [Verrucomicrobia bacterium]|nr:transcription-repair coupling factor [Verrucomicrobiota bacterium]
MNIRSAISKYAVAINALQTEGQALELPAMPASAEAITLLALSQAGSRILLWLHDSAERQEQAHRDLLTLRAKQSPEIAYFPQWDALPRPDTQHDPEIAGLRLRVLQSCRAIPRKDPLIIVASIQALLQTCLEPEALEETTLTIELDGELDLDRTTRQLLESGYTFEPEVLAKGQVALKGGLLDLWPPTDPWPTRIELFGSTVESMRRFDSTSQRSVEKCAITIVPPAVPDPDATTATLLDYLDDSMTIVWSEPGSIRTHAAAHEALWCDGSATKMGVSLERVEAAITSRPAISEVRIAPDHPVVTPDGLPQFFPLDDAVEAIGSGLDAARAEEARTALLTTLYARTRRRSHVTLFLDTPGSVEHFEKHLNRQDEKPLHVQQGVLTEGCDCPALRLVVVAESNLYGRRKSLRRRYDPDASHTRGPRHSGARITDFTDMEPGDLVVHIDHGIGRYLGVQVITFDNEQQEVLAIAYADDAKLYVPMSHAHLLSRYVGLASREASLHRLGGARWSRDKSAAQQSVLDLAAGLLEVQAARNLLQGHAFPADTACQHEFDSAFPFQETEDQIQAIRSVKADMESTRPMDRLVCGDAGYGKTEVAMRAAFKAVQDGRQVAMLVPTTILAQQHFRTFTERMAGFPARIEVLSRFCTAGAKAKLKEGLDAGSVDIVIGTHALVQGGIQFANLGLVIIDEEQRFGVHHKEHLKQMKRLVDVLTLSATPIPRTLYMSMTGARDMSLIQTPPQERMAIETIVARGDDEIIREAILRELGRDGQVYYLHNRVMTIRRLRDRLAALVPEAKVEFAHGQMKSSELSQVMRRFSAGEFDVLLCTTIIESGLDIPRANTILIDRADRFGIADLYQLRGRVGRSNHKAYAYLLLPPHGFVDRDARERIRALRKHSGLGTGFNLAIRDMEIRGAGNILGAAQSGHISAVGFGLYCQLLKRSVARLKGETQPLLVDTELRLDFIKLTPGATESPGAAYVPSLFIPSERLRVAIYRRIAEATEVAEIEALRQELEDRFGRIPPPVSRLLTMGEIRIQAARNGVQLVEVRRQKIIIKRNGDYVKDAARFATLTTRDPDEQLEELRDALLNMIA